MGAVYVYRRDSAEGAFSFFQVNGRLGIYTWHPFCSPLFCFAFFLEDQKHQKRLGFRSSIQAVLIFSDRVACYSA